MYTIGTTGKINKNYRSSKPTIIFYYRVIQKDYQEREQIDVNFENTVVPNGGRYYVEFSSKNPTNSKLLLNYPVPTTILSAPDSGWSYMPGYMNK